MVDMHLEGDVIPVSDVARSKQFYIRLGWRLDDDVVPGNERWHRPVHARGLGALSHVRQGDNMSSAKNGEQIHLERRTERGFHKAGDVENRLGYYVGQLGI
jgi:catechol 2,3-dioxygenase-like lactoylglutathione lyase family enzyme